MRKGLLVLGSFGALLLGAVLYHGDAVRGQWRFEQLCRSEGGGRVYATLEKNAGWLVVQPADDLYSYKGPFQFRQVAFVRWHTRKGERFDVYRDLGYAARPYPKDPVSEFTLAPADEARPVRYRYVFERSTLPDDRRFSRHQLKVIDLRSGRLAASFTEFHFQAVKPERVILNAPTSVSCPFTYQDHHDFSEAVYSSKGK